MAIDRNTIETLQSTSTGETKTGSETKSGRRPWKPGEIWGTPDEAYRNQSGLNDAARGGGRYDQLVGSEGCGNEYSEYGKVRVTETEGGHQIIMDDTFGSERILIKHASGSGIEFKADGSIHISATKVTWSIEGDFNLNTTGNLNFKTDGSLKIDAGGGIEQEASGDIRTKTAGGMVEDIRGNKFSKVGKDKVESVVGASTNTTVGRKIDISLGGYQNAVKGDMKLLVDGSGGIYSTGDLGITSETNATLSSVSTSITGNQLEVTGAKGTIGGENMIAVAYNAQIGHTLTAGDTVVTQSLKASKTVSTNSVSADRVAAPYIQGDLKGVAELSAGPGTFSAADPGDEEEVADDEKTTAIPTPDVIAKRLASKKNGIRNVYVDRGGYIRDSYVKTVPTGGEFT